MTSLKNTIEMDVDKMKRLWFPALLILILFHSFFLSSAFAHTNNSEGFSNIEVKEKSLDYELKLDLEELGHALDKETEQKELIDNKIVQQYVNAKLKLYADSEAINGTVVKTDIEMIEDRPFAVINLAYNMEHKPEKLVVEYNMFLDDSDPSHANFASIKMNGEQQEKILILRIKRNRDWRSKFLANDKTIYRSWLRTHLYGV